MTGGWIIVLAVAAGVALDGGLSGAQAQPGFGSASSLPSINGPPPPPPDPVVAEVEGHSIRLSEVGDAIHAMPGGGGQNAFQALYPMALRRLIEREALVIRAQADGVAEDPAVRRQVQEAADVVVERAYLRKATAEGITEQMLLARYATEIQGKPGPTQVHARVILVAAESAAEEIIAKLASGAEFAALARQSSTDASAAAGGDLGFLPRSALSPELGAVLFALRPGEVAPYPVRTPAGWFVVQTVERRPGPTPSFAEAHERLEAECAADNVVPVVRAALSQMVVRAFDMTGHEMPGTSPDFPDSAVPAAR